VFGKLPSQYEQELKRKYRNIDENLSLIQASGLSQEQKIMLQKFIETSFKDNLQMSGEQRQLDHLAMIFNNISSQQSQQGQGGSISSA
jgi:hypothetical protein